MFKRLENLRSGVLDPFKFKVVESTRRSYNLNLSKHCDVENIHTSGISTIDVDNIEGRYLLSGCVDGTIYIHDLYNLTGCSNYTCKSLYQITKDNGAHRYSVESVQWYPFDTGLFTTSSMDKTVKVWDANLMKPADVIRFKGRIFQHHMSIIPSKSSLIAVATDLSQVILAELKTGLHTHELRGHCRSVVCCRWSPRDEFLLATGSIDSKIILWDIRSAKSWLMSLDQHNGKGGSKEENSNTAHNGIVNGLCFTANGMFLLSIGTDNSLRLWNVSDGKNQMINYGNITNSVHKHVQLDVSTLCSPNLAYIPTEGNIFVFEVETGNKVTTLSGHYNLVSSCYYHTNKMELYSAGHDRNLLVWVNEDGFLDSDSVSEGVTSKKRIVFNEDCWSSDEEN